MNIEKLAKHLKEFTLEEIEMIAECDCKTKIKQLLNNGKLGFENGKYKYKEPEQLKTFDLFAKPKLKVEKILFRDMALHYITSRKLTKSTIIGYKARLNYDILPVFGNMFIDEITYEMLLEFANRMKEFHTPKTASNGVTLLGSIMKAAFIEGYLKTNPYLGIINSKCK
ncbi:MAG: phage integrase central domain-containing protein [Candidatus Gastranaerophilaceae bacterium]